MGFNKMTERKKCSSNTQLITGQGMWYTSIDTILFLWCEWHNFRYVLRIYFIDTSTDDEEYLFQLVQFCQSQDVEILDVDIVPTSWISWNKIKRTCMTKYPSPPYTAKVCHHLQQRVQNNRPPLARWPWWDVIIKGGAGKNLIFVL